MPRMPLLPLAALLLGSTMHAAPLLAQTPQERADRAEIDAFLKEWKRTNLIEEKEFDRLRTLGPKRALSLLSAYLPDPELGFLALHAMQKVDPEGSAPYLLKNLSRLDFNVQRDTFRLANLRLEEYAMHLRAGSPKPDPTKPPPRYPRATTSYPYAKELHDAAVTRLKVGDAIGAEREAVQTLGLTGNRGDFALLREVAKRPGTTLAPFCTAALARLGDRAALDAIAKELDRPVTPKPAEGYMTDAGTVVPPKPGHMVTPREDGDRVRVAAWQAGFAMNRRLIPALMKHLDDPPGQSHGDYFDPNPAQEARTALARIVFGKEYGDPAFDWKAWWREHEREFGR